MLHKFPFRGFKLRSTRTCTITIACYFPVEPHRPCGSMSFAKAISSPSPVELGDFFACLASVSARGRRTRRRPRLKFEWFQDLSCSPYVFRHSNAQPSVCGQMAERAIYLRFCHPRNRLIPEDPGTDIQARSGCLCLGVVHFANGDAPDFSGDGLGQFVYVFYDARIFVRRGRVFDVVLNFFGELRSADISLG